MYLTVINVAEAYGLPKLPPYLASSHGRIYSKGVNFAVAGATALDPAFFQEQNLAAIMWTNSSLSVQLSWFEQLKPSLCHSSQGSVQIFNWNSYLKNRLSSLEDAFIRYEEKNCSDFLIAERIKIN